MSQKPEPPKVSELRSKFDEVADYNLALSLQEEEFSQHYDGNRKSRRISVEDHRVSSDEQIKERRTALALHLNEMSKISQEDERLALELQKQFEEEYDQQRQALYNADMELAQKLASENNLSSNNPADLPSSSNQNTIGSTRSEYDNELESLFQPSTNINDQPASTNSLTPNLWSSTNPFLQDLIDFNEDPRTLAESNRRERSTEE